MSRNDTTNHQVPFVSYLERLRGRDDRAALAALRRGVGKPPGTVIEMYPYVVPWLGKERSKWDEDIHYIVASLFALHSDPGGKGNMGYVFKRIRANSDSESIEGRFKALLNSHGDELAHHLRHAVSLAKSKGVPIDWHQLYRDVHPWNSEDKWIQKRWAESFWAGREQNESEEES